MTETSVVLRILHNKEIQDRIFSYNDIGNAVRCALVCQAWKEKALDYVWFELQGFRPFFNLLAPLKEMEEKKIFSRRIQSSDWIRVAPYARRVKKLVLIESTAFPYEVAFFDMLVSRPEGRTFPNLAKLKVVLGNSPGRLLKFTIPLIHDKLPKLKIFLGDSFHDRLDDVDLFLEEIGSRSTALRTFSIKTYCPTFMKSWNMIEKLSRFFANQTSLESVALPPGSLTTVTLKSLSLLPKLRGIYISQWSFEGDIDIDGNRTITYGSHDGMIFPKLFHLELQTRVVGVTSLISSHATFAQLRRLEVDMVRDNDAKDIQKCIELISMTCKGLEHLEFARIFDGGDRPSVLKEEKNPITKDTLSSLTLLSSLTKFTIAHTQPIKMSDDALVDFLKHFTKLEEVHLNPNPVQKKDLKLPLPTLGILQRICPSRIKKLSLFLTATRSMNPDLPYHTIASTPLLDGLQTT